jgi:hypothetical protein
VAPHQEQLLGLLALGLAGLGYGLYLFFRRWREQRFLEDTPSARIRSAPQGYVKLAGEARATEAALLAPLTRRACVWWTYRVETRSNSNRWNYLEGGTSDANFLLYDGEDHCLVEPEGADVEPSDRRVWCGNAPDDMPFALAGRGALGLAGRYRYTECVILPGARLAVLGDFRVLSDAGDHSPDEEVRAKLSAWKHDQATLMKRFDANHDGQIDALEWERARVAAREEVAHDHLAAPPVERIAVVGRPGDGRPYLVAAGSAESLARTERLRALLALGIVALALVYCCYVLARLLTLR